MHLPAPPTSLDLSSSFGGSASVEAAAITPKLGTEAADSDALARAPLSPLFAQVSTCGQAGAATARALALVQPAPCNEDPAPPDEPGPQAGPAGLQFTPDEAQLEPMAAAAALEEAEGKCGQGGPTAQVALPGAGAESSAGAVQEKDCMEEGKDHMEEEEEQAQEEEEQAHAAEGQQAGAALPAAVAGADSAACPLCMEEMHAADVRPVPYEMPYTVLVCGHSFCLDCLRRHVGKRLGASAYPVPCPQPSCTGASLDLDLVLALAGPSPPVTRVPRTVGVAGVPDSASPSTDRCRWSPRPNQPGLLFSAASREMAPTPAGVPVPVPAAPTAAAKAPAAIAPTPLRARPAPGHQVTASAPPDGPSPVAAVVSALDVAALAAAAQRVAAVWLPAEDWYLLMTDSPYWIDRRAEVVAAAMAAEMAKVMVGAALPCGAAMSLEAASDDALLVHKLEATAQAPALLTGKKRPRSSELDH